MARFSRKDIEAALCRLGMLRYWPSDPSVRAEIGALLVRMVPHKEALDWLVSTMIDRVGEWTGPKELRGILCWRWPPLDGVEANSSISGFTPDDGERLTIERGWPQGEDQKLISADEECRALVLSIAEQRRLM